MWSPNGTYVILGDEKSYDPSSKSVARARGEDLLVFLGLGLRLRRMRELVRASLLLKWRRREVKCKGRV